MQCMEIRGGNRAIERSFVAPGLDVHVWSKPYEESLLGGGDLYYLTSCASGRITRLLLADVSGHGESASQLARGLRDLLRENVNAISQESVFQGMNRQFGRLAETGYFATAVVATFFEPRRSLALGVAGHPRPLYYQSATRKWLSVIPESTAAGQVGNLPLGIVEEASFPVRDLTAAAGDMFLLYSDSFIEAVDEEGQQLGTKGLGKLLNQTNNLGPGDVIPFLRKKITALNSSNLLSDDSTAILGHVTARKVSWRDNLLAPFRMLRGARDRTGLV